jgi:hypothetical protein
VSRAPTKAELIEAGRPDPGLRASSWVDMSAISAAGSRDVLEREERGCDNRTFEQRSAQASMARSCAREGRGYFSLPARTRASVADLVRAG